MSNLTNKFNTRFIRNNIAEGNVKNSRLCFQVNNDKMRLSLDYKGQNYIFTFDNRMLPNELYTQILKKANKRGQNPAQGFEGFTWEQAHRMIDYLKQNRGDYF